MIMETSWNRNKVDDYGNVLEQKQGGGGGSKLPVIGVVLSELRAFQARRQADSEAGRGLGDQLPPSGLTICC